MIRKIGVPACVLLAGAWGWIASASALYCTATGKMALYRFPFTQWLQVVPYWRLSGWMTALVIGSAALPLLFLTVCVAGIVRHQLRSRRLPIYGETGWANRADMDKGGISTSRTLR